MSSCALWLPLALPSMALAAPPTSQPAAPNTLAIRGALTLNVKIPTRVGKALIDRARALGGYFSLRQDQRVVLKVPAARFDELLQWTKKQGDVLQHSHHANNLGQALAEKRSRLASKQAVLKRYMRVLQSARVRAVVTVERQITQLVQEIEQLQGAIHLIEHQLRYAQLQVDFRITTPSRPASASRPSPFEWLNTVNLPTLYGAFSRED